MNLTTEAFTQATEVSFEFLKTRYEMTVFTSIDSNGAVCHYVGSNVAVDIHLEHYSGELGATIRQVGDDSAQGVHGYALQTFLACFGSIDSQMSALIAKDDAALRRLITRLADGVCFVMDRLTDDPNGAFALAAEMNALYGRDLVLNRLRSEMEHAWASSEWRAVVLACDAIEALTPPVELQRSELAKVTYAKKKLRLND